MYSLYFHSKTFNERIWHTKKIKRHLSLLKLYANFVMHVDFYLVIFFRENEDWEDLPFFWKNLQADVLHSLLNFAAETTTNSFGCFNATQNTPYIILTKK